MGICKRGWTLAFILPLAAIAGPGCISTNLPKPVIFESSEIHATLTLPCKVCSTRDFSVRTVFLNTSERRVKLNHFVVQSPQLTLDVFNAKGKLLPPVPPPLPPDDLAQFDKLLFPGESYEVNYPLAIVSDLLPNGEYAVRARGFPSNTVYFRLVVR